MATSIGARRTVLRARAAPKEEQVVRFDVHQRIQHFLMMSSFIVLTLTGMPQKFSDLEVSQRWVELLGGLGTVREIHHIAGIVMLADGLYHIGYLATRIGVQRRFGCFKMLPTLNDIRDGGQMVLYFLRLRPEKPRFDRFSYLEKFDYWAVFWGITVIGGSGIVLMFAVEVSGILPGQSVTVAHTLHSDEAVLAVGWIAVVHMFNVHLAPWVFPFNPAIFTGKMSATRYAEDHPLEWERLQAGAPETAPAWTSLAVKVRSAAAAAAWRPAAAVGRRAGRMTAAVRSGTRKVVSKVRQRAS